MVGPLAACTVRTAKVAVDCWSLCGMYSSSILSWASLVKGRKPAATPRAALYLASLTPIAWIELEDKLTSSYEALAFAQALAQCTPKHTTSSKLGVENNNTVMSTKT